MMRRTSSRYIDHTLHAYPAFIFPQLEQDFELASNEYEHYNNMMKTELPQFMVLSTHFIDPLFHSFFYMQSVFRTAHPNSLYSLSRCRLNIFYIMVEKLQGFAEGKYEVPATGADIAVLFEERRGNVQERIESFGVTKRVTSTCRPSLAVPRIILPFLQPGCSPLAPGTTSDVPTPPPPLVPPSPLLLAPPPPSQRSRRHRRLPCMPHLLRPRRTLLQKPTSPQQSVLLPRLPRSSPSPSPSRRCSTLSRYTTSRHRPTAIWTLIRVIV